MEKKKMNYFVILLVLIGIVGSLSIIQDTHALTLGMASEKILETQEIVVLGNVDSVKYNSDHTEYAISVLEYVKTPDNFDKTNSLQAIGCGENQRGGCITFETGQQVLFVLNERDKILDVSDLSFVAPNPDCSVEDYFKLNDAKSGLNILQNNQTKHFFTGEPINLTFYAYNKNLDDRKYNVTIEYYRANNNVVFSKTFEGQFEECVPNVTLETSFSPSEMGKYGNRYTTSYGDNQLGWGFPIIERDASPLKQFKHGIHVDHILCQEDFVLVQKYDGTPACVTESTKQKLIERGWTTKDSSAQKIIERLKQGTQPVNEADSRYIETLALMNQTVSNFVYGVEWTSQCCGYSENDGSYELTITFLDSDNQKQLGVTFDLDTMHITDIQQSNAVRIGKGLSSEPDPYRLIALREFPDETAYYHKINNISEIPYLSEINENKTTIITSEQFDELLEWFTQKCLEDNSNNYDCTNNPPLFEYNLARYLVVSSGLESSEVYCESGMTYVVDYENQFPDRKVEDFVPVQCITDTKLTENEPKKNTINCKENSMPSEFTLKKNTWISIAHLSSDKVKGDCTIITNDTLSSSNFLKNAIDGANGCKDDLVYCGGGRVTLERGYDFGVSISDGLDYELSLSKQQAESLLHQVTLTPDEDLAYGTIKYNDKYYQIILHSTDSNTTSHVKGQFVSISEKPVPLQRGSSVDFTYSVESFATFGSDAKIKIITNNPARDSGLEITAVPSVLEIPERTQENATIIVSAGKDAKDGIYQIRAYGRDADSGGLIRTDHLSSYPKVNVGNSSWEIFTYGNDRGSGFSGATPPPKWAWAELELNQDTFYENDMMEIRAYIVNNGTEALVLDEAKLLIQIIRATSDGYYSNLYGIDAKLVDGETITVEPKSRELLARPFFWDQMTFSQNEEPYRADPAERKIQMTLGHYNGTVWRDEVSFVMK